MPPNNPVGLKKQQQVNLNTIKPEVGKLGALITTAESVKFSIPAWVKKSATTLDPKVRKQLADGTLLERNLGTAIADGPRWHTSLQAEIKATETKVASIK